MKSSRSAALLGIAMLAGTCFAGGTNAMRVPRIELLREVRVTGADVLLSDLFPAGVRSSVRARAENISPGSAPQLGYTRALERSAVLLNIGARPDLTEGMDVPEHIVVSRETRSITLQEVFEAIRAVLDRNGISAAANLRPADILLQTQILVAPGDAGLEVLRSDFDAELKRGRFLLWASRDPKVLPFFVTVRWNGDFPTLGLRTIPKSVSTLNYSRAKRSEARMVKEVVLVSAGEQATLLLHSNTFRMIADVIPLERGTMGQRIHVRVIDTGKIFSAQVDGRAHLETNF